MRDGVDDLRSTDTEVERVGEAQSVACDVCITWFGDKLLRTWTNSV